MPTSKSSTPPRATASTRRPGAAPQPRHVDWFACSIGLGLGVSAGLVVEDAHAHFWAKAASALMFAGNMSAMIGAYLLLVMVLLTARIPWLERAVGQDRLLGVHRRLGAPALTLIIAHVVLTTMGLAATAKSGMLRELWTLVGHSGGYFAALLGTLLLVAVALTSIRAARRRLAHETWWLIHLVTYAALLLAFAHQISSGTEFMGHPAGRAWWLLLWLSATGAVAIFRVGLPVWRSFRHDLRVESVSYVAPGVVEILLRGRDLESLAVSGGQFFQWRFLTRKLWWQAHPYSLSALPNPPFLRVTVKELGDHSGALAQLRSGTRVAVEGPYGAFTYHARAARDVVLVGAGVGVTPLRALLEDLPSDAHPVVIMRARRSIDIPHRDELIDLVKQRGGTYRELLGARDEGSVTAPRLKALVPDITTRDVYVCGPGGFVSAVQQATRALGLPRRHFHHEVFAF